MKKRVAKRAHIRGQLKRRTCGLRNKIREERIKLKTFQEMNRKRRCKCQNKAPLEKEGKRKEEHSTYSQWLRKKRRPVAKKNHGERGTNCYTARKKGEHQEGNRPQNRREGGGEGPNIAWATFAKKGEKERKKRNSGFLR